MSTSTPSNEPKLDRPGAGLPIPFRWVARWLVPIRAKRSHWNENVLRFERHARSIEAIAASLTEAQLNQRVLVEPILGLEDSSRYWSAGMVLDHLTIAGQAFKKIIFELSQDRVPPIEVRVEKVKPPVEQRGLEVVQRFHVFYSGFMEGLSAPKAGLTAKLLHPWFGKLNAHAWMYVHSVHFGVHLQQIRQIERAVKKT